MPQDDDRTLAEDFTTPVEIRPGSDHATPKGWDWKYVSTSQPNAAVFHISHSESTRVLIDYLGPEDSAADANFVLNKEIPIVILVAEAKRALAADLAAQLRLLLLLSSSHKGRIAPALLENMKYLSSCMEPGPGPSA